VTEEVSGVTGIQRVEVDLDAKLVRVSGTRLDAAAVRASISEAGYDAVPA
jgi:copper chaperone CopZ